MKDQKGSNDFAVQSKCVTSIYRTSSLANQIRCLRKNHLRLTIYHYISMKRQVFDMEMDQKPLPSGYLTDCHGKKTHLQMVYHGLPIKKMGGSFHGKLLVITRWYLFQGMPRLWLQAEEPTQKPRGVCCLKQQTQGISPAKMLTPPVDWRDEICTKGARYQVSQCLQVKP